jgi:hypothetical protein
VTSRYGLLVTTVPRTVIDLARTSPFREAVVAADSALQAELAAKADLATVAGVCHGWPGIQQARRVIEFSDERAESVLESCAGRLRRGGPQTAGASGHHSRPRLVLPRRSLLARIPGDRRGDGLAKYNARKDLVKQFERDRLLRDLGYQVIHFTWRELMRTPEVVIGRIRAAIAAKTAF